MYSQNDEEAHVIRELGGMDPPGRFLDIGACDGKLCSNTLALVERGWSGVLVEPSPRAFLSLLDRHGDNEKLTLVNVAVGASLETFSNLWTSPVELGYDTTEVSNKDKWQIAMRFSRPYFVPIAPLIGLLLYFGCDFDLVSIDTEGTSVDLFKAWPLELSQPKMFIVEHDGRLEECRTKAAGYSTIAANQENLIFLRDAK